MANEMEWSRQKLQELIDLYRNKEVLWNPKLATYKDRNLKNHAWGEIAATLKIGKHEIQCKMKNLITCFRREGKKGKSGAGASQTGKWWAFESLLFLNDKLAPNHTSEAGMSENEVDVSNPEVEDGNDESLPGNNAPQEGALPSTSNSMSTPVSARARAPKRKTDAMAEEAYKVMKEMAGNRANRDEFDAYGQTVAMTLRKLSNISAVYAKYEINKILFQAELGQYEQPLSRPASSATSASSHSAHSSSATPLTIYEHSVNSNNQENVKSPSVLDDETEITAIRVGKSFFKLT